MSIVELHHELFAAVYGRNVMSEGTLRQWCRTFKDGRTNNVHDEERSGRASVVSDDLVQSVDQKVSERWSFTISELSYEFPQISRTLLYEIITVRLDYHHKFENKVLRKICIWTCQGRREQFRILHNEKVRGL
jgi:hypothetical protein